MASKPTYRYTSIEQMAANFSDSDDLASVGSCVLLVRAACHGTSSRLNALAPLGDNMVAELAENEIAYGVHSLAEIDERLDALRASLADEQLLTVESTVFQMRQVIRRIEFDDGEFGTDERFNLEAA